MKASLFYLPSIGSRAEIEAGMAGMRADLYQRMLQELSEQIRRASATRSSARLSASRMIWAMIPSASPSIISISRDSRFRRIRCCWTSISPCRPSGSALARHRFAGGQSHPRRGRHRHARPHDQGTCGGGIRPRLPTPLGWTSWRSRPTTFMVRCRISTIISTPPTGLRSRRTFRSSRKPGRRRC